ncbi:ribonuclease H-like domain-containing protein [Tanacetum coccineum]
MLKPGKFEVWRMRIEQYIQMIDYALWEVIENGATLPKTAVVEGVEKFKFNSIKDAKKLLEPVEKRFGGNAATKKTQRNLLKQQYENFTAPSSEMLDQIFDRLQNLWKTHAAVWRNKAKLEIMSMDDLYNNLKVYELEVKGMSSSSSSTQNMAFVSSLNNNTSSSNEVVNIAHGVTIANTQVNTAFSTNIDNLSDVVICLFFASQPNSSQLTHEDLALRNQDNENKESLRRSVPMETSTSTALVSCDGLGGYDWSDHAEEGPNYTLMAYSSSSFDSKVSNDSICSKSCLETVELLKSQNDQLLRDLEKSSLMVLGYKTGPPPYTRNFMPSTPDLSFTGLDEFVNNPIVENSKKLYLVKKSLRCSRHMTWNISYLIDYEEIDGGYVAFKGNLKGGEITGKYTIKTVPRKNNMYSVDLKNIVPKGGLTCLFGKATSDESKPWHRRLGHLNFKTMNKMVKGNLVRGLPSKLFENDQTCVACQKRKQHIASYDYSRFTWVFFQATKDETSGVLKSFITVIENLVDHKVKVIRVAERRNGTLIKAARTMLADSKLPTTFWAEAVNTACYVQNRVLVVKPHKNTLYELFHGRTPTLSFMRPFGCPVTILNTIDQLSKFDVKADEGFFVGYSLNSKSFRVFNSKTRIMEENLHIRFSESTPNIVGIGPDWLFDIDALTRTMNYEPIVAGTQSNGFAGTKASDNADLKSSHDDGSKPLSDNEKKIDEDPRKDSEYYSIFDFSRDDEDEGALADMNNLDTTIQVSPNPTTRIHKDRSLDQVIGDLQSATQDTKDKFGFFRSQDCKHTKGNSQNTKRPLLKDKDGKEVDVHMYRSMIGSLMYLTSSRPDIMFAVCACARYQVQIHVPLVLSCARNRQWLQNSTTEAEYVAASSFYGQVLWIQNQLLDYGHNLLLLGYYCWVKVNAVEGPTQLSNLKFADTHNLVAFLSKPAESEGFKQIVDFLNAQPIRYALTVNPTIYTSCIEQFWSTVKAKTINGEVQLHALVDGKKIIVTESTIRRELQLEDAEGIDCLPNSVIFEELTRTGAKTIAWNEFSSTMASAIIYLATNQKFNFSKYIFESMVRNLDNVSGNFFYVSKVPQPSGPTDNVANEAIHKELGDSLVRVATTAFSLEAKQDSGNITKTRSKATPNESSSLGTTLGGGPRCQETMGDTIAQTRFKNVSKLSNDSLLARSNTLQSDEDRLKLNELMELYTNLQQRVFDLEKTKTSQQNEIDSLKRRVKKLKRKDRSRTHKLKRLYKVGLTASVESSRDKESLGEDASKQGKKINAIDADEDITLVNVQDDADNEIFDVNALDGEEVFVAGQNENVVEEVVDVAQVCTAATTATITTEEITLAQALEALKTLKPKVKGIIFQEPGKSTTTKTTIISSLQSQDKGKGIMVEEPVKTMKKKDLIILDEEIASKLQAEFDKEERLAREKAE